MREAEWPTKPGIFIVVQSLSPVQLLETPRTAAHQASLSFTISRSLLKPMSMASVTPSNQLTLCRPLLLLPSVFPSIRVFSNQSTLPIRWPKYWSFSLSFSPSNEYSRLISFRKVFIVWPLTEEVCQSLPRVKLSVAQLCATLCNPRGGSPPGSSIHRVLQARTLEWVATPFSRESS